MAISGCGGASNDVVSSTQTSLDQPAPVGTDSTPTTVAGLSSTDPDLAPADLTGSSPVFDRVRVLSEPGSNGIYDPALAYAPDGTTGWMAYTSADGRIVSGSELLHTHLAFTTDGGASWEFAQRVNESIVDTVTLPSGELLEGVWHYEVPSLAYDAGDAGREWKLFAHRLFWTADGGRNPVLSWITLRTAADPAGEWSDEIALFSSGRFPPPPYDNQQVKLNDLHPELAAAVIYTEPGAMTRDGTLYLSITGLTVDGAPTVFLLASPDHGDTWEYRGVLTDTADAEALGVGGLDGADLVSAGSRVYLLLTPIKSPDYPQWTTGGTYVLEVSDLEGPQLFRNDDGAPHVLLSIPLQSLDSGNHGGGQATYDPGNSHGGILIPQINLADKPDFTQIFNTAIQLPLD